MPASDLHMALVIPSLNGGGAERATADIASELATRGVRTTLILEREGPRVYDVGAGVEVHELRSSSSLSSLVRLRRWLTAERPDVVYAALPHLCVVTAMAAWQVCGSTRVVLSVHNNQFRELKDIRGGSVWARLLPWAYRRAANVVAVSRGVADEVAQIVGEEKVQVVPNPIPLKRIRALASEPPPHAFLERPGTIVSVGRLTVQKDHHLLLRAFRQVANQEAEARLIVVGDGPLRAELERFRDHLGLHGHIAFAGATSNPFAYMTHARCLVLSSAWEGFGMVLVEAMAAGAPVISTDCKFGPREILGDSDYGLLVPPGDAEALAEAMVMMLTDDGRADELRRLGFERAEAYSPERVVSTLLGVLNP